MKTKTAVLAEIHPCSVPQLIGVPAPAAPPQFTNLVTGGACWGVLCLHREDAANGSAAVTAGTAAPA